MNYRPLRGLLFLSVCLAGAGCASPGGEAGQEEPFTACTDPRPQICTMEHRPVCARLGDGREKSYSNGCSACSDTAVTGYRPGDCE